MPTGDFPRVVHKEAFLLGEEAIRRSNLYSQQNEAADEHIPEKQDYMLGITYILGEEFLLGRQD